MKKMNRQALIKAVVVIMVMAGSPAPARAEGLSQSDKPPNVVLILTDDQGYGDLSAHGNPVLKTPKLDALHGESVRFTDFHVAPMCTPTRGELLTGLSAFRNGATAVCEGRSLPRRELPMMAQFFKKSGYVTGHFGKWHLGDNYPYRPQDRGFDETVHNCAWGIKSLAEHWENDAFDDRYWHNNELRQFKGYNTDVFFKEAMNWIEKQEKPFFVYLPTTAAHAPFVVPEKYSKPYLSQGKGAVPSFFGMIANIDENVAALDAFLAKRGLKENTIFIFMTDNGTVRGHAVFNAGMRGKKTSQYDGGHRVPFFLRWPAGGYNQGRDIDALTHSTDLLPTLIDLCGLERGTVAFDGHSLRPLLEGKEGALDDRKVVIQYRAEFKPWSGAVLWKRWRLVDGKELHNIAIDPGQEINVYDRHPEVVRIMRDHYQQWVAEVSPVMGQTNLVSVGTPHEKITWLSACNWTGSYADNWGNLARQNTPGHWNLQVETTGNYRVAMYMFHPQAKVPLNGRLKTVKARPVARARLLIDGVGTTKPTAPEDTHATFELSLKKGQRLELEGHFLSKAGEILSGAFYTFVQHQSEHAAGPNVIEYVSATDKAGDWVPLFDGESTKGWTPRAKVESFEAKGGELRLSSKVNVWVVSDIEMADFEVEAEVKIPADYAGFNSGLGFRLVGEKGKPKGYQCEIDRGKPGGVHGIGMGGWLYPIKATATEYRQRSKGLFKPEEWNKLRVVCKGPSIKTYVNGKLVGEVEHEQSLEGRFGIQHHGKGGTVAFRNLRARKL